MQQISLKKGREDRKRSLIYNLADFQNLSHVAVIVPTNDFRGFRIEFTKDHDKY